MEPVGNMKTPLVSGLGNGQQSQGIEHDEAEAGDLRSKTALLAGLGLCLKAAKMVDGL
jgi:hypothetical protein